MRQGLYRYSLSFKSTILDQIINSYLKKYPGVSEEMAKLSLRYHQDVDFTTTVTLMDDKLKWRTLKKALIMVSKRMNELLSQDWVKGKTGRNFDEKTRLVRLLTQLIINLNSSIC